jgi:hypothetical protein
MARIQKVQPLVYNALVDKPETRTDDFILVLEVLKNFVTAEMGLETVLKHHTELGIPSFASIIRIRRKLQSKHPELVNEATAEMRLAAEKDYKDYALNN